MKNLLMLGSVKEDGKWNKMIRHQSWMF